METIQTLVPKLLESLGRFELGNASIGIVTPYRAQEDRLNRTSTNEYERVTIGTAHKFQGDERDIMIFSPVVASGMSEGSLKWLDVTKNLLNVAVTRARIALIIVGDWDYCKSLPASHCFRHLADYVQEQNRVLRELDNLPFFGEKAPEIIGYVTDPHNPEYNRTTLRRFISTCKEFIWWTDPYFDNRIFD